MWDANITTTEFKGKLPLQSANNLMGAIRERCQGAGVAIPAIFATDYTKFELLPKTWFSTFQSTITTLIPKYVNHTDNSGDWNGQTTIPNWTEATILTAIGDASRLAAPSSQICAKWCFQTYKILNMLRWVKISGTPTPIDENIKFTYRDNMTFSTARIVFNGLAFGEGERPGVSYGLGFAVPYMQSSATPGYYNHIWRSRHQFTYNNSSSFNISVDYFVYFANRYPGVSQYWNDDYNAAQNVLTKIYNNIEILPANSSLFEIGNFNDCPDLSIIPNGYNWNASQYHLILKFTGPNGFGFRDWS